MGELPTVFCRPAEAVPSAGSFDLPPDLLAKSRARIERLALVMLVGVSLGTLITQAFQLGGAARRMLLVLQVGTLVLNLVVFWAARSRRLDDTSVLRLGLAYEVAQCLMSSLGEIWVFHSMTGRLLPSIWVCVLLVAYPLLVPSPPRTTLIAALLSAATIPLAATVLERIAGLDFTVADYVGACIYAGVCVAIAYFGSRVVYSISREVAKARRFGSYQLTEKLGGGGMGEVWKATHSMLSRPAAVKLIRPDALDSDASRAEAAVRRFTQEVEATASLRSPHTVDIYDFGLTQNGDFFYVMEVLDGIDLQELVQRFGPLPENRAVHLLQQVCHSLYEAHSTGLVHRDIKPANLFVCRYGAEFDFIKVLDFGLVKEIETEPNAEEGDRTQGARIVGTPACMAPEMALGQRDVDGRADLYALGCVGYWLLTATLPFPGDSPLQTLLRQATEPPEPPGARSNRPLAPEIEQLVLGCLAKDPEERPDDAADLSARLRSLAIPRPWTQDDARQWWDLHLPPRA